MSYRSSYPPAREASSHYFFTVSRGGKARRFAVRPAALFTLLAGVPVVAAIYLAATAYLFFRDDMMAGLMARQAKLQYAYEDRLAAMRIQLDRVTSRQLLDQDSFEGKVQGLISRQAKLETRTALVAALGDRLAPTRAEARMEAAAPESAAQRSANRQAATPKSSAPAAGGPNQGFNAFAPTPAPVDTPFPLHREKPRPEGFELRSSVSDGASEALAQAFDADLPMPARLESIGVSLDRIERRQVSVLAALAGPAAARVEKLKSAISEAGLAPEKIVARAPEGAVGGPFTPSKVDTFASPFERQLHAAHGAFVTLDKLRRAAGVDRRQPQHREHQRAPMGVVEVAA